ncbi:hypothetical protein [Geoalkalibacter halelectricus]
MKRIMMLLVLVAFTVGMIGCATTTEPKSYRSMKAPTINQPVQPQMDVHN